MEWTHLTIGQVMTYSNCRNKKFYALELLSGLDVIVVI